MSLVRSWATYTIFFTVTFAFSQPEGRLMRFPDIHGDRIAFVYGGDIWLASASGGEAHRITTHPGLELFPKFSPDGRWIAFTGQYDGNFNVYVMSSDGGQPRQLTFYQGGAQPLNDRMGIHDEVLTWTPDSKRILFLSRRDASNGWIKRPFTVSIDGGLPEPLSLDQAGLISFNADGTKIAYNRIFRNFRTWKRYTGGLAQDIYIYDLKNNIFEQQVPHTDYTDTFPMWHGKTVYFTSDRGPEHRLNIYAYDLGTKQVEQITHFTDFDVMWPSLGDSAIIFQNAGYLYVLDLNTHKPTRLTITLPGERDLTMKHWESVSKHITDIDIAPDGKRAVFAARGDVFTVPAKEGAIRNLTHTPGIREKEVAWSPDGRWIAFVSDRTGEDEIYITPQDGMGNVELGTPRRGTDTGQAAGEGQGSCRSEAANEKERGKDKEQQITSGYKGFKYAPVWSPDSKNLAWSDQELRLWYVDINDKKPVEVDRGKFNEITNYSWSPDSKWMAYDKALAERIQRRLSLFDRRQENHSCHQRSCQQQRSPSSILKATISISCLTAITTKYWATTTSNSPIPKPHDLISSPCTRTRHRLFRPLATKRPSCRSSPRRKPPSLQTITTRVRTRSRNPMTRRRKQSLPSEKPSKDIAKNFRIDLDGLQDRIVALPVPPAVIAGMGAAKGFLYYLTQPVQGLSGPLPGEESAISMPTTSKSEKRRR